MISENGRRKETSAQSSFCITALHSTSNSSAIHWDPGFLCGLDAIRLSRPKYRTDIEDPPPNLRLWSNDLTHRATGRSKDHVFPWGPVTECSVHIPSAGVRHFGCPVYSAARGASEYTLACFLLRPWLVWYNSLANSPGFNTDDQPTRWRPQGTGLPPYRNEDSAIRDSDTQFTWGHFERRSEREGERDRERVRRRIADSDLKNSTPGHA